MQTAPGWRRRTSRAWSTATSSRPTFCWKNGVQRVKITDFGLARAVDDASLTQSGVVAGTPKYMAPEQARGETLDHRADLFSLGSVLYAMCTGRPPFRAAKRMAVLRRVSEDRPRPIRETNPEIPEWLVAIVDKLMAKEPAERCQSAAEVEELLGRNLAQLQHASWVPPPRPTAAEGEKRDRRIAHECDDLSVCGASLHVPELMVGSLVHCFECGKPFHVEDGSEVMQIARPANWPVRPRLRSRGLFKGCFVVVAGIVGFLLFFALVYSTMRLSHQPPQQATVVKAPQSDARNHLSNSSIPITGWLR